MVDDPAFEDLGCGVYYTRVLDKDSGEQYGIIEQHLTSGGERCSGGMVPFDVPLNDHIPTSSKWTVEQAEPLTLFPSLLCRICGHHGWIRDGRWISA